MKTLTVVQLINGFDILCEIVVNDTQTLAKLWLSENGHQPIDTDNEKQKSEFKERSHICLVANYDGATSLLEILKDVVTELKPQEDENV